MNAKQLSIAINVKDRFSDELDDLKGDLIEVYDLKQAVRNIDINVDVDGADSAVTELKGVDAAAESIDERDVDIDVDTDSLDNVDVGDGLDQSVEVDRDVITDYVGEREDLDPQVQTVFRRFVDEGTPDLDTDEQSSLREHIRGNTELDPEAGYNLRRYLGDVETEGEGDPDDLQRRIRTHFADYDVPEVDDAIRRVYTQYVESESPSVEDTRRIIDQQIDGVDDDTATDLSQEIHQSFESDRTGVDVPGPEDTSASVGIDVEGAETALTRIQSVERALDSLDDKQASVAVESDVDSITPSQQAQQVTRSVTETIDSGGDDSGRLSDTDEKLTAGGYDMNRISSLLSNTGRLQGRLTDIEDRIDGELNVERGLLDKLRLNIRRDDPITPDLLGHYEEAFDSVEKSLENRQLETGISTEQARQYIDFLRKQTESVAREAHPSFEGVYSDEGAIPLEGATENAERLNELLDETDARMENIDFGSLDTSGEIEPVIERGETVYPDFDQESLFDEEGRGDEQMVGRLDRLSDAIDDSDVERIGRLQNELSQLFDASNEDWDRQRNLILGANPEEIVHDIPDTTRTVVEDVQRQVGPQTVSGQDELVQRTENQIRRLEDMEDALDSERGREFFSTMGVDVEDTQSKIQALNEEITAIKEGDSDRSLRDVLDTGEGLQNRVRQAQKVRDHLKTVNEQHHRLNNIVGGGELTYDVDYEKANEATSAMRRELAEVDRLVADADIEADTDQLYSDILEANAALDAFDARTVDAQTDLDNRRQIQQPQVGNIQSLLTRDIGFLADELGLGDNEDIGQYRTGETLETETDVLDYIRQNDVLPQTDVTDYEFTTGQADKRFVDRRGDVPDHSVSDTILQSVKDFFISDPITTDDFLEEGVDEREVIMGEIDAKDAWGREDISLEESFGDEESFRQYVAHSRLSRGGGAGDGGDGGDGDGGGGGVLSRILPDSPDIDVGDYLSSGVDKEDVTDEASGLKRTMKSLDPDMSTFYDLIAQLVPQLAVFVMAMPAAIAALGGLAAAGISAAAVMASIGALSIGGLALMRGDGNIQEGLTQLREDLVADAKSAFIPLMGQFDDLGDDFMQDLDNLMQGVASEAQAFTSLKDEAREASDYVVDFLIGTVDTMGRLAEAIAPLGALFGGWLEDADIIEGMVGYLAQNLPTFMAIVESFLTILPTIMQFSQGMLKATQYVFLFWEVVWSVIGLLGPFAEGLGVLIGVALSLATTIMLVNTVVGIFSGTVVVAALQGLWSLVSGFVAAGLSALGFATASGIAATAVSILTGGILLLVGALAAIFIPKALDGLMSGFGGANEEIKNAREQLKSFKDEQSGMSGSDFGSDPYSPLQVGALSGRTGPAPDEKYSSGSGTGSGGSGTGSGMGDTYVEQSEQTNITIENASNAEDAGKEMNKAAFKERSQSTNPF